VPEMAELVACHCHQLLRCEYLKKWCGESDTPFKGVSEGKGGDCSRP